MAYSNTPVDGSLLTEASMMKDLENLSACYKAMDIAAEILPIGERKSDVPALVALVPLDEEGQFQVVTNTFLPLDKEDAEFTKYLQFYACLERDADSVDPLALLEAANQLNHLLPLGSAFVEREEGHQRLAVRCVQGYELHESVHPGVLTEDILLFETSWALADEILDALTEGKSVDEAFARLK